MIKYIGGRASGKTYRLMQLADRENLPIVVADNEVAVKLMNNYAESLGFKPHFISLEKFLMEEVTFEDILSMKEGKKQPVPILIDDADEILKQYMPMVEIKAMSISAEQNKYMLGNWKVSDVNESDLPQMPE